MIALVADHRARQAALATVEGRRAAHALAMVAPMVDCAFVGEPRIVGAGKVPTPLEWYACQYGTALLRKRDPAFAGDLSHLRARLDLFGIVEFLTEARCRKTTKHPTGFKWIVVATVVLPPMGGVVPNGLDPGPRRPVDLRSGDRAAPPVLPAPSTAPAIVAGQTEGTAP